MEKEDWKPVIDYEGLYEVSNLGNVKSLFYNHTTTPKLLYLNKKRNGYVHVILHKNGAHQEFSVHRLVAAAFIPNPDNKPEVDHINRVRHDNRACNLRWCTKSENIRNPLTIEYKKSLFTPEMRAAASEAMRGEKNHFYGKKHSEHSKRKMSESLKGRKIPDYLKKIYSEIYKGEGNPHYGKKHTNETREIMRKKRRESHGRAVVQLTKDGNYIASWETLIDAANATGSSIGNIWTCCRSTYKTCKGYRWMYKEDYDNRNTLTSAEDTP